MENLVERLIDQITLRLYFGVIGSSLGSGWLAFLISDEGLRKVMLVLSVLGALLGVVLGVLKILNEVKTYRSKD